MQTRRLQSRVGCCTLGAVQGAHCLVGVGCQAGDRTPARAQIRGLPLRQHSVSEPGLAVSVTATARVPLHYPPVPRYCLGPSTSLRGARCCQAPLEVPGVPWPCRPCPSAPLALSVRAWMGESAVGRGPSMPGRARFGRLWPGDPCDPSCPATAWPRRSCARSGGSREPHARSHCAGLQRRQNAFVARPIKATRPFQTRARQNLTLT